MKQLIMILSLACALTIKAQEAVNLGLSVAWADRNIGADAPEKPGFYLAWGELTPKKTYTTDNYRFYTGEYNGPSKYVPDNGETWTEPDNKLFLDAEDDIATTTLGEGWRMPTYDELTELTEKCQWQWEESDSARGYRVTGPNGNSIFLPVTGYYSGDKLHYPEAEGYYWSNQVDNYLNYYACLLRFTPRIVNHPNFNQAPRDIGLVVRAVYIR